VSVAVSGHLVGGGSSDPLLHVPPMRQPAPRPPPPRAAPAPPRSVSRAQAAVGPPRCWLPTPSPQVAPPQQAAAAQHATRQQRPRRAPRAPSPPPPPPLPPPSVDLAGAGSGDDSMASAAPPRRSRRRRGRGGQRRAAAARSSAPAPPPSVHHADASCSAGDGVGGAPAPPAPPSIHLADASCSEGEGMAAAPPGPAAPAPSAAARRWDALTSVAPLLGALAAWMEDAHSEVPPFRRRQLLAAFHAGHTQCLAWGEPCASVAQLPRKALVLLRGWLPTKGVEAAGGYSASADEFSDASSPLSSPRARPRCGVARTPSPPRGRRRSRSPRPRHALRSAGERAASAARPGSWLSIQQAAGGEPSPARGRPQAPLLP
jgi:hypothetical protein